MTTEKPIEGWYRIQKFYENDVCFLVAVHEEVKSLTEMLLNGYNPQK